MTALDFRLAYALAKINKEFIISVFYLSIHINSYRKASRLHAPKYQSDHLIEEIKEILDILYGGQYTFVHDGITCYVTGQSIVDDKARSISDYDLLQRFFYYYILKLDNANRTQSRAAPVLFKIGEDEYRDYLEQCRGIGLDLAHHVARLSYLLPTFLSNNLFSMPKSVKANSEDSTSLPALARAKL